MPKVTKQTVLAEEREASANGVSAVQAALKNNPATPSFAPAPAKELQTVEKSFRKVITLFSCCPLLCPVHASPTPVTVCDRA